jgi:endonuclease/exonuclease/phosphatase family metal-dependent hydrolase/Icc-related predicted phosphoesterase
MRTKVVLIVFLSLVSFELFASLFPQRENTHRLMSYNIRHARGMDDKVDIERIGALILSVNPEVVALQEVDSVVGRSGGVDIMLMLSIQTGMYASFGSSIPLSGGSYGNGVLTREKPLRTHKIMLPGRTETRSALVVEMECYVVVNTHLSLDEAERLASVKKITASITHYTKPVFLLGDLNAQPGSEPIKLLQDSWQLLSNANAKTYPSDDPQQTIDYVMGYTKRGETYARYQARVIDERIASDHRPLFVDIRLKTPADQVMRTMPYLQNPGTTEMTVMWLTNVPVRSWVEYGTDPDNLQRARTFQEGIMVANTTINRIHLKDLKPGTTYYYRAVSQEITRYSSYYKEFGDTVKTELKKFTTWSDDARDFRVIVYNDLHSNMAMFDKLHALVEQKPYDLVIFNGDCFDDPEVEDNIVMRLQAYNPRLRSDEIPAIYLRGNHETRGEYSMYLWDYLGRMGGDRSYSAFSLGDTRFVLLDCGEDKPDDHWVYYDMNDFTQYRADQAEFLMKEIKSRAFRRAKHRVMIHHIPIYGNKDEQYNFCSDCWLPVLAKAPFSVALNGHTHRHRVIEKGEAENNFPVVIGGGNREDTGTVMVLEKKGGVLRLELLNVAGEKLVDRVLN